MVPRLRRRLECKLNNIIIMAASQGSSDTKGVARGVLGCPWPPLLQAFFNHTTYNRWRKCHDDILAIVIIWWVPSLWHSVTPLWKSWLRPWATLFSAILGQHARLPTVRTLCQPILCLLKRGQNNKIINLHDKSVIYTSRFILFIKIHMYPSGFTYIHQDPYICIKIRSYTSRFA